MKMPRSSSGSRRPGAQAEPGEQRDEHLLDPAGPQVEQVEEVGRQQQQREVGDVVDPLAAEPRGRVGGQRQRPDRLDRAGREAAGEDRRRVAAPAAVGVVGVAPRPSASSSSPSSATPEDVHDPAAQLGVEQIEVGAVVEHRERRQGDERAGDQRGPGREGDLAPGVVRPRQPGTEHVGEPWPERDRRNRRRDDQPGEHQGRDSAPKRRFDGAEQVRELSVGGLLDPELALGAAEHVDKRHLPSELVNVVDTRQRVVGEESDRARVAGRSARRRR